VTPCVFFFLYLTYLLNILSSRSIHIVIYNKISFFFMAEYYSIMYTYYIFSFNPYLVAIINSISNKYKNEGVFSASLFHFICVHMYSVVSFIYALSSVHSGSYNSSICFILFYEGCPYFINVYSNLYFHQQRRSSSFSSSLFLQAFVNFCHF
jgi:hypothetical protein